MNVDVTEIVVAVIGLIGAILTGWAIPYLKSKTTKDKWSMVISWAKTFVQAAEVLYDGSGRGEEKREYVLAKLREKCKEHNISYNEEEIRATLESAFLAMVSVLGTAKSKNDLI